MLTSPYLVLTDVNPILISWTDYTHHINSSPTNIRATTSPVPRYNHQFYVSQNSANNQALAALPPVVEGRFCA